MTKTNSRRYTLGTAVLATLITAGLAQAQVPADIEAQLIKIGHIVDPACTALHTLSTSVWSCALCCHRTCVPESRGARSSNKYLRCRARHRGNPVAYRMERARASCPLRGASCTPVAPRSGSSPRAGESSASPDHFECREPGQDQKQAAD